MNLNTTIVVNDITRWAENFGIGQFINPKKQYHVAIVAQDDYGYWVAAMRPARAIYMGLALTYMGFIGLLFRQ